jgi:hypothetical protein
MHVRAGDEPVKPARLGADLLFLTGSTRR